MGTDLFAIRTTLHTPYTMAALPPWFLPGWLCPLCTRPIGASAYSFPSIQVHEVPASIRDDSSWNGPTSPDTYNRVAGVLAQSFQRDWRPGAGVGRAVGECRGGVPAIAWGLPFQHFVVREDTLESMRQAGLALPPAFQCDMLVRRERSRRYFEFEMTAQGVMREDSWAEPPCPECGLGRARPSRFNILSESVEGVEWDLWRLSNYTHQVLCTRRCLECLRDLGCDGFEHIECSKV